MVKGTVNRAQRELVGHTQRDPGEEVATLKRDTRKEALFAMDPLLPFDQR